MNANRSGSSAPNAASWSFAEQFVEESEVAAAARAAAGPLGVTPVGQGTAAVLTLLARLVGARAVVEIGTGSGVSGLALFAGMAADGVLTSVDIEPEHQAVARKAFTDLGIAGRRFRLIAGAALSVLPKLSDGAYDLVFLDGDKLEYPSYVQQSVRLLRSGGVLAIDNALWHDRIADTAADDAQTAAVREAIELVRADETLTSALLPTGDGLLVAVRS